jgi:thiamine biosynthesis protein ThiI
LALVTGESIGQVASQTMQSLVVTDDASEIPVFRPLIGMDKEEITKIAREIGTFETSILPYEDCCTVFTPKHPNTRPSLDKIKKSESMLDTDSLVKAAVQGVERIVLKRENSWT